MAKHEDKGSKSAGTGAHASKRTAKDTGYVGRHRDRDGHEKDTK